MMMRRRFAVAFFVIALPALAQQDPDVERGYRPGRSYETAGAIDSTNLFNGTVNLAIPLGQTYVVGGTLSYALSARYATNAWDTGHHEIETEGRLLNFGYTFPWKHGNAGHSWIVTLGKIEIGPDDPVYIGPDGTQHRFYLTLHGSNPAEQPISGFRYTRDGSYLRLKVLSGGYELRFPNGHKHTFDASGLLAQMEDPFGNFVSVVYSDQGQGDPFPGSKLWTITDSTPRTHKIYFRPGPEYEEGDFGVALPHQIVYRVDLAAFGGTTARYVFSYENENGGFSQVSRRCARLNDADMQVVNAPLLAGISLSGMLQYSMEYAKGDQVNCSPTLFGATAANFASGNITKVTLPTGGWIEWTYRRYLFPGTGSGIVHNAGVATRTVKKDADTILAQTTYEPATVPIDSVFYDVVRTVREKDAPYHTRHYFGACRVLASPSSCRAGGLYGLPGTITDIQDGAHLAVAVYEGTSTTPARRIYRRYEGDYYLKDVGQGEFNQRLASEKTVYEDGSSNTTTFTDFDGLGHYRSATTTGSWGNQDVRTTFTNFNPTSGSYAVNTNHTLTTSFSMPATSSAWILSTFDKETVTESSATRTAASTAAAVCFDSLGFMTMRRVYKNGGASPLATVNDLVVRFTRDGNGNLMTEQYVGGDAGTLAPATHSCATTLSSESYRLEHRYTRGVRERSYYSPPSGDLAFFLLDRDIDPNTGLVSASWQSSTATSSGVSNRDGIETEYLYDLLGRLTDVLPQGTGRRAKTKYNYVMNPPSISVSDMDGTTTIRSVMTSFDVLGRMLSESRTMPVGTATRSADYDVLGRKTADRGWDLTEPTRYSYDTFGRPITITAPNDPATTPDGTITSFAYTGASAVDRTVRVKTGPNAYTAATTTEQYDTLGRLWRVTEPAVGGVRTITEYTYDTAGRLSHVCANKNLTTSICGQVREFEYDNRGFLLREKHPEKGTAGNGETRYRLHDARGHVGRRYEGADTTPQSEIRFTYDRAERLRRVYRPSDDSTIKAFTFGSDNGPSDWRNGKITQAVRFNRLPVGLTVKVFEDYKYDQPDGLISQRTTWDAECWTGCETHTSKVREFIQTFSYDKLSSPVTLGYPDCEHTACTNATTARTVTNTYTAGWLSSVNWTGSTNPSQITYHGTGAVNAVTHGNSVVDTLTLDAGGRTKQLTTTNAWDAASCVAPTFTTQPQSVTVVSGQSTALSAAASGDSSFPLSYQWYNGTPPGTASPAGSTSTSLSVSSPTQTATYWVRASNACGSADSVAATVTVCLAPGITTQPQAGSITRGQTKQLTVVASGSAQLNYQWYTLVGSTATPINGAISAAYAATPSSTTTYRVRVTNDCGAINSSSVTVTVAEPPTIPASILATKEGTGIRLQWSPSVSSVGIASYRILRQPGGLSWNLNATTMLDVSSLVSGQAYVYRVSALDGNGARSEESPPDLVTFMTFDDDPLLGAQSDIRGIHVGQLRQAIDAVRAAAGLPPAWSSYGPATGDIHASDFFALRDRLNEGRVLLQVPTVTFDPLHPVGGSEEITAAHVQILRGGVQ